MKTFLKFSLLLLFSALVFTSCRTEDDELINPPEEEAINANSEIANLLRNIAFNDGSVDNIIDNANCFTVQLPVTVIANGTEIVVNTPADYALIEAIFDASDDDTDTLEILFPITVIFADYTTQEVNSYPELLALAANCSGENESDDDIECIDIQYPITASVFNANNELIETIVITNDQELYNFIQDLPNYDAVTIDFPITVILSDGTSVTINSISELVNIIQQSGDDCDEDDDNDYDDDDCETCSTDQLSDVLTNCNGWFIDKLERNDQDLEDSYTGYVFVFGTEGSLTVTNNGEIFSGTYASAGEGNNIAVTINVPALSELNEVWNLHEIETNDEIKVDLRLGDDRLRFECGAGGNDDDEDCDSCTTEALTDVLTNCPSFFIDTLERNDEDLEDNYTSYDFAFSADGSIAVTSSDGNFSGTWTASGTGNAITVQIAVNGLPDVNDTWNLHELETTNPSEIKVDLRLGDDRLRFESDCDSTGGGDDDITIALTAPGSVWFVGNYTEDNDDQTTDYTGYEFIFNTDGSITVQGAETSSGIWNSLNSGNDLLLDFGPEAPLEELNDDDWEVLSVTADEVLLRDISGGNGGTDLLTLIKL